MEEFRGGEHQLRFSSTSRRCLKKKAFNRLSSRAGSSSCQSTRISVGGKTKMHAYAVKTQSVSLRSPKTSNKDDGHICVLETKKNGTEAGSKTNGDMKLKFRCSPPVQKACSNVREVNEFRSVTMQKQVPQRCYLKQSYRSTSLVSTAVLILYLGRRREGDQVAPNTHFNIAQNLITALRGTKPQICLIGHR